MIKPLLKKVLGSLGYTLARTARTPDTLLGLTARPIRTVVDAGANTGQFARRARRLFPAARLHCFEPVPEAFAALSAWAAADGAVTCHRCALGDAARRASFNVHADHPPSSSLLPTTARSHEQWSQTVRQVEIEVEVQTLDAALAGHALETEILVKLDVQGFEDRVIAGATATLERSAACLLEVSVENFYEGQATFLALATALDRVGLRFAGVDDQAVAPDGHVLFFDALFTR